MRWLLNIIIPCTLFLATLPTGSASVIPSTKNNDEFLRYSPSSAPPTSRISSAFSASSDSDLFPHLHHKRRNNSPTTVGIHQLPSGWSLHITQLSFLLLPLSTLSTFYEDIMAFASHASESLEEEHTDVILQFGHVLITFLTNEEMIPVSWDLIHDFARAMMDLTRMGLGGGLDALLRCGAAEVVVRVGLVGWGGGAGAA